MNWVDMIDVVPRYRTQYRAIKDDHAPRGLYPTVRVRGYMAHSCTGFSSAQLDRRQGWWCPSAIYPDTLYPDNCQVSFTISVQVWSLNSTGSIRTVRKVWNTRFHIRKLWKIIFHITQPPKHTQGATLTSPELSTLSFKFR